MFYREVAPLVTHTLKVWLDLYRAQSIQVSASFGHTLLETPSKSQGWGSLAGWLCLEEVARTKRRSKCWASAMLTAVTTRSEAECGPWPQRGVISGSEPSLPFSGDSLPSLLALHSCPTAAHSCWDCRAASSLGLPSPKPMQLPYLPPAPEHHLQFFSKLS